MIKVREHLYTALQGFACGAIVMAYITNYNRSQLPLGAEIYERTSISVDGLRVFTQQLNHGFEIGDETYETDINGGDLANIFGLSK